MVIVKTFGSRLELNEVKDVKELSERGITKSVGIQMEMCSGVAWVAHLCGLTGVLSVATVVLRVGAKGRAYEVALSVTWTGRLIPIGSTTMRCLFTPNRV